MRAVILAESANQGTNAPGSRIDPTRVQIESVESTVEELPTPADWKSRLEHVPVKERAKWLHQWWGAARAVHPDTELRDWILQFLFSGIDHSTGLDFRVGPGGNLETAPSLRVQVMDWLGSIDADGAAAHAKTVLIPSAPPDEWAISLRNYGRILETPSQDAYYVDRVEDLLQRQDWLENPTGGFLEAFDTAVYSGSVAVVDDFLTISLHAAHAGTRQAAIMSLDNLAGDEPLMVARQINVADFPIAELSTFRASLVSRLDPRIDTHVAEIRRYLIEVPHGISELEVFAQTFPNANDFTSHYLLTNQTHRNLYEMARVDLTAYRLVREWKLDPDFAKRRDTLSKIETRLRAFLESAVIGGLLEPEDLP